MCDCISLIYVSAVAPLIGRYCGTKIPPEIQSSSGLLSLSFHTDMAVAKDGFSARYNMTHKEVSDCECRTTWTVVFLFFFHAPRVPFCSACFYSHLSADTLFLRLSLLLTLSISPALPALMLFRSQGSRSLSPLGLVCALS